MLREKDVTYFVSGQEREAILHSQTSTLFLDAKLALEGTEAVRLLLT